MTTLAPDLTCRLLCAAEASYGISPIGPYSQHQPYYNNIGYLFAPTIVQCGDDNIDAALVGINGDGIIVAFRGTLPPTPPINSSILLDWLQDFLAVPNGYIEFPGHVHVGFYLAMMNLWPGVLSAVKTLRATYPNAPIYVTGHSKGGALASLGAWLLYSNQLMPTGVVTFASPHTGDADFAAAYNQVFNQIRYENYLDLVPFVPPAVEWFYLLSKIPELSARFAELDNITYTPVGKLQYIQKDSSVIDDNPGLTATRIAEIMIDIVTLRAEDVAKAHSLVGYAFDYYHGGCAGNMCTGGM